MPSLHTKDNCNGCSVFADDNNMIHSSRFFFILQILQRYFAAQKAEIIMKIFGIFDLLWTSLFTSSNSKNHHWKSFYSIWNLETTNFFAS